MATLYWFAGSGTYATASNWATAAPIGSFTATCSTGSTAFTITSGTPALAVGMTIKNATNTIVGVIASGSNPNWVLQANAAVTATAQPMRGATISGSAPNSATPDNVVFDANASGVGYTVTIGATFTAQDFTVSGGTVTFTGTQTTNFRGNISFAGSTTTWSNTGSFTIVPTTASVTIGLNTGGTSINATVVFNGVATATLRLDSAVTLSSGRSFTLSGGTLSLNNFGLSCSTFSTSTATAKTINFGSSGTITVFGSGTVFNLTTGTGPVTISGAGSRNVSVTNATTTAVTVNPGTRTESDAISFTFSGLAYQLTLTAGNYNSLNFSGYIGQLQNTAITVYGDYTLGTGGQTFAATITNGTTFASTNATTRNIRSNGKIIPFPLIFNGVGGSWSLFDALTCSNIATGVTWTNGSINLNNNNLTLNEFILPSTAATFTFGTGKVIIDSTSGTSNVSGGSGVTYATATSIYNFVGTVNSHTIGLGFTGTNVPSIGLPASAGIINLSGSANLDTTGFTGTLSLTSPTLYNTIITPSITTLNASGTLTFATTTASNTTVSVSNALGGTSTALVFNAQSGRSITLQSNITIGNTRNTSFTGAGTVNLNGFTLTTGTVLGSGGSITMNNGIIVVVRDDVAVGGPVWVDNAPSKVDFNDATGSIQFSASSPKSMDTNTTSVLPTIAQTGSGNFTLTNTNGTALNVTNISSTGGAVFLGQALTFYFTNFTLSGCAFSSANVGVRSTVSKSSGTVSVSNLTISGINAVGGAIWNAFTSNGNVNGGSNSGWNFTAIAGAVNSAFFLLF